MGACTPILPYIVLWPERVATTGPRSPLHVGSNPGSQGPLGHILPSTSSIADRCCKRRALGFCTVRGLVGPALARAGPSGLGSGSELLWLAQGRQWAQGLTREDSPPRDTGHHLSDTSPPGGGPFPARDRGPTVGVTWRHKADPTNLLGSLDPGSEQVGEAAPWPVQRPVASLWEVQGEGHPGLSLQTESPAGVDLP